MKKKHGESFFWTSYSDLMTSLFFIMLVLFVLVIVLLHKRMEVTEKQLTEIKAVINSTKDLDPTYFDYRSDYKKYILKVAVKYPKGAFFINDLNDKVKTKEELLKAGKAIENFLKKQSRNRLTDSVKYLIIIEGQASKDSYKNNYQLSYERALGLYKYWRENNIDFGKNSEVQISGSGDGQLPTNAMREKVEVKNQRFLIQILPKNILLK